MNTCECFSESFSDYVDNTVLPDQKRLLEAHLSECPSCHDTIVRLQNLRARMHTLPRLKASPDFETILRTRIMLERKKSHLLPHVPRKMRISRAAVYASAGLLVLFALGALMRDWQGANGFTKRVPNDERYISSFYQPAPDSPLQATKLSYPLDRILPAYLHQHRQGSGARDRTAVPDSTPEKRAFSTGLQVKTASF